MQDINDFLFKYDSSDLKFNTLQYRKGARITGSFGLSEGYRFVENKMVFDTARIHSGTDRGKSNSSGINVIIAPFDFQRADYIDYGKDHVYGSVLRLFNDEFGFEMRVIHLDPEELTPEFRLLLSQNKPIPKNTVIGLAGSYGSASSGRHTHTEIISYDTESKVLDDLLELIYREDAFLPYTEKHVLDFYRKQDFWKNERRDINIIIDFQSLLKKRKIQGKQLNDFRYTYLDWYTQSTVTRYSSEKLFNGL